jgi:mannose-6-phosphate isomerase
MPVYLLKNEIMPYAWGTLDYIPELLGVLRDGKPAAELWLGAHPKAPSLALEDGRSLIDILQEDHEPELPFLMKVLSTDKALSIQAHPDMEQAKKGFTHENLQGIALDSPKRNYRDANHKPELAVALTEFDALIGFRDIIDIKGKLAQLGPVSLKREISLLDHGIGEFYKSLLYHEKPVEVLNEIESNLGKIVEGEWIRKLMAQYPGDLGAIAPAYLNLVHMMPGQGVFLEARTLHAYLKGSIIEVMANSDNVVRGGLTEKYMDKVELLKIVDPKPTTVTLLEPARTAVTSYNTPATEFALQKIYGKANYRSSPATSILLCTEGQVILETGSQEYTLGKGKSVLVHSTPYSIRGDGIVYETRAGKRVE